MKEYDYKDLDKILLELKELSNFYYYNLEI